MKKTNPILGFGLEVTATSIIAIALQQFRLLDLIYDIGFTKVVTINKESK